MTMDFIEQVKNELEIYQRPSASTTREVILRLGLIKAKLEQIVERADNGTLGTSKVIDMKKLAKEALDCINEGKR